MKETGTPVVIATSWNRRNCLAIVLIPGRQAYPLPGRGPNCEGAIADACAAARFSASNATSCVRKAFVRR